MANTRVYYATQAVGITPRNPGNKKGTNQQFPKGLQSVGVTTNFNLEQVFQLGQLEIFDNVENVPDVEVSLQKIADGSKFLYPICVEGTGVTEAGQGSAFKKEIGEVSTNRCNVELRIYKDTSTDVFNQNDIGGAASTAYGTVTCSGMYLSSIAYTIPVEGFITEDVTLVGNSKIYSNNTGAGAGEGGSTSADGGKTLSPHKIGRRINLSDQSVLPTGTPDGNKDADGGIMGAIAINQRDDGKGGRPYLQNINVSMDLGREAVFELGKFAPYARYATFPIEVSSEFEVLAESHDQVQARDFDDVAACSTTQIKNLDDQTIKLVICGSGVDDNYIIDLGEKNKLTSVNFSGGDTGGGNATITYSYQTFNKFTVDASGSFENTSVRVIGG
tara:strand:- start:99 stop:1262 length:1164 start_codon:yes stop_codon:yes gene_type:complete